MLPQLVESLEAFTIITHSIQPGKFSNAYSFFQEAFTNNAGGIYNIIHFIENTRNKKTHPFHPGGIYEHNPCCKNIYSQIVMKYITDAKDHYHKIKKEIQRI